jgi:hypothetical protein
MCRETGVVAYVHDDRIEFAFELPSEIVEELIENDLSVSPAA